MAGSLGGQAVQRDDIIVQRPGEVTVRSRGPAGRRDHKAPVVACLRANAQFLIRANLQYAVAVVEVEPDLGNPAAIGVGDVKCRKRHVLAGLGRARRNGKRSDRRGKGHGVDRDQAERDGGVVAFVDLVNGVAVVEDGKDVVVVRLGDRQGPGARVSAHALAGGGTDSLGPDQDVAAVERIVQRAVVADVKRRAYRGVHHLVRPLGIERLTGIDAGRQ